MYLSYFNFWQKISLLFLLTFILVSCVKQYIDDNSLEIYPHYYGEDLGLTYTGEQSQFKVWSPVASSMKLKLYKEGKGGKPFREYDMKKYPDGIWSLTLKEDLEGYFYTYLPGIDGKINSEVQDPYSYAVGINGNRSAVIDLQKTNPQGWEKDVRPPLGSMNEIVLYEMHIRDISIDTASGILHKGKFLGITESNTRGPGNVKTGLDHLVELGITHVHLLPAFDFASIDEEDKNELYNWGYDPQNYNVPEGSYATDAFNPAVRIREFKAMVMALHSRGIRVVMDAVYNHTYDRKKSCFQELMPDYYYRQNSDGSYSNASGCGNEVATERTMVRKLIIESVNFWAREYHIDGFRFDLMGVMDVETMKEIRKGLDEIDPSIFIYGEGWSAGASSYGENKRAVKTNIRQLPGIAAFSDELRDGVKGSYSNHEAKGFVSGAKGLEESIKFGIMAATLHPQVQYKKVNYATSPWAKEPDQCINYVSCHDDLTLWDKLKAANTEAVEKELIRMQLLSNTIVLTSQGIPFLHAGVEFLRTKGGDSNLYISPDSVNKIDWARKAKYEHVFNYYKKLIAMRKNHPAFRMNTKEQIQKNLEFYTDVTDNLIVYEINGAACGDEWKKILVAFNGSKEGIEIILPEGNWDVVLR
nr:type I pullulanase [Bacteroidota bacterium]